jgi:hypothetical protein
MRHASPRKSARMIRVFPNLRAASLSIDKSAIRITITQLADIV